MKTLPRSPPHPLPKPQCMGKGGPLYSRVWFWNLTALRPGLRKQLVPNTCWPTDTHTPSVTTRRLSPRLVEAQEHSPLPLASPGPVTHLQQAPFLLMSPWFQPELAQCPPALTDPHAPPETRYVIYHLLTTTVFITLWSLSDHSSLCLMSGKTPALLL